MTKSIQVVIIPRDGISTGNQPVRAIYSELTDAIMDKLGEKSGQRASNVEFGSGLSPAALTYFHNTHRTFGPVSGDLVIKRQFENLWCADMTPSGGPVLGPYTSREVALNEEVIWLQAHNIPICAKCTEVPTPDVC